jgi:uncharacterized protein
MKSKCPVCGQAEQDAYRPFCSKRCADVDLHRWLSGGYVIAGRPDEEEDSPGSEPPRDGGEEGR